MGTSRNKVLEQLWAWYLRMPGAELPERPPAEAIEKAFAAWREREAARKAAEAQAAGNDQPET